MSMVIQVTDLLVRLGVESGKPWKIRAMINEFLRPKWLSAGLVVEMVVSQGFFKQLVL
jgi:hypothetical protein